VLRTLWSRRESTTDEELAGGRISRNPAPHAAVRESRPVTTAPTILERRLSTVVAETALRWVLADHATNSVCGEPPVGRWSLDYVAAPSLAAGSKDGLAGC
jgi:hypothetical protein